MENCKFCDAKPQPLQSEQEFGSLKTLYFIRCNKCDFLVSNHSKDKVISIWNTRVIRVSTWSRPIIFSTQQDPDFSFIKTTFKFPSDVDRTVLDDFLPELFRVLPCEIGKESMQLLTFDYKKLADQCLKFVHVEFPNINFAVFVQGSRFGDVYSDIITVSLSSVKGK